MNFARLVDLAIREYEAGRWANEEWWAEREAAEVMILQASSHFETCVVSMHRAVCHLRAVKGHPGTPPKLLDAIPTLPSVLSKAGDRKVEQMRHAIQHLEERILGTGQPSIKPGEAFALYLGGNKWERDGAAVNRLEYLELGKHRIRFWELTLWLAELNRDANALAEAWW